MVNNHRVSLNTGLDSLLECGTRLLNMNWNVELEYELQ